MPIVAPDKVSIVIAGEAPVSLDTVSELLSDWLRLDSLFPVDANIYLPADDRYVTRVVTHAVDWCADREIPYDVVAGAKFGRAAKEIQRGARDSIRSDADDDMVGDLVALLDEDHRQDGRSPYLIVALGDGEVPDEQTYELVCAAWEAGVIVLEIAALALEELTEIRDPEHEPEPPAVEQPAPEAPETNPCVEIVEEMEKRELEGAMARHPAGKGAMSDSDEAQADLPLPDDAAGSYPDLPTTLAFVYTLLSAEDRANAARNTAEVKYRPLTMAVRHHFMELEKSEHEPLSVEIVNEDPEQNPAPIVTEMKPRGRTRAKDGEVAVLVDAAGEVVDVAGKGRPPKGLTRKIIAIEDLPEHLTSKVAA